MSRLLATVLVLGALSTTSAAQAQPFASLDLGWWFDSTSTWVLDLVSADKTEDDEPPADPPEDDTPPEDDARGTITGNG
jgi:hypothetical protein